MPRGSQSGRRQVRAVRLPASGALNVMRHSMFSASRQRGLTLIELMVSLVIGFAVVGALLAAYMASFRSSAHNDATVQVAEDATLALNVIRTQVAMAGYTNMVKVDNAAQ